MSDESPSVTAGPPATADPQDPLPESNWKWRRIFVFVFGSLAIAGVAAVLAMIFAMGSATLKIVAQLGRLRDVKALDSSLDVISNSIAALQSLGFWLIMLVLADRILYLIAPSAEQAAKMMATVSAWKGGISTSSFAKAQSPDGSTAEAGKSAGPAVAPAKPAAAPTDESKLPPYARANP